MIDLTLIDPRIHEKYSPNLHKWLKRHAKGMPHDVFSFDEGEGFRPTLYVGFRDDGFMVGSRLGRILGFGARAERGAYVGGHRFIVVPEFWQAYQALGRCAIDVEHRVAYDNATGRYTEQGDARLCNWCGATHMRVRWTEMRERERWEAA